MALIFLNFIFSYEKMGDRLTFGFFFLPVRHMTIFVLSGL
jgi:hypothetical protein